MPPSISPPSPSEESSFGLSITATVTLFPVSEGEILVHAAAVDPQSHRIWLSEFTESFSPSATSLPNTEAFFLQLAVKRLLYKPTLSPGLDHGVEAAVTRLLERCRLDGPPYEPSSNPTPSALQDMKGLLQARLASSTTSTPHGDHPAIATVAAPLAVHACPGLPSDWSILAHTVSQYMQLDTTALYALHILPPPANASATPSAQAATSTKGHLYGLLNRCKTAQGSRLLEQWLRQPLTRLPAIMERQDLISLFIQQAEIRHALQDDHLGKRIPDLDRLAGKLQSGRASLQDAVRAYQVVEALPSIILLLERLDHPLVQSLLLQEILECQQAMEPLARMVEETVDLEKTAHHIYIIRPSFDQVLEDLSRQRDDLVQEMEAEHQRTGNRLHVDLEKKLKLEHSSVYGHCMRLTRNDAGCLRKYGPGSGEERIIELATQKAGVYFTTRRLRAQSEAYSRTEEEYAKRQSGLVKEVITVLQTYMGEMRRLGGVLSHLDVLLSLALVSSSAPIPYIRPTLHGFGGSEEGRILQLRDARHPCLEAVLADGADPFLQGCIGNDVRLHEEDREVLLVTGPNMGGKSTYIRQIGLILLMAQIGCFVPCSHAELSLVDAILVRIGAGDRAEEGISTFMSEMLETRRILEVATRRSLVMIDELGRGTSTQDGFGLAWAITERLAGHIRPFTLVATHFHELTQLSNVYPSVGNVHVVAETSGGSGEGEEGEEKGRGENSKRITLLYQVREGVCDESFGIHVAELAAFPSRVVKMAKRKADVLEGRTLGQEGEGFMRRKAKTLEVWNSLATLPHGSDWLSNVAEVLDKAGLGPDSQEAARWMAEYV
ncbi:MAG: DNA mismatch repair protein msh-2 [Piptocephalis tieghemiana]|nr:MAG: DNA mismatch repair protein msh-2 [Piptocephalis tieghemiana]